MPFVFNTAQKFLHDKIEAQIARTGKARILVVKGRQQGCSTYIGGRYYHKATRNRGKSVFILSHEATTTGRLFTIVERFHEHVPVPAKPALAASNRRELKFEGIDSDYMVGTAGNENTGRGATIQYFHGSEVGFWEKTDEIETGIMQAIPDMPGTEIILESTGNGMNNMFYRMTSDAIENKSEYEVVFIPWFWQPEYTLDEPHDADMELTDEEAEQQRLYGLTDQQVYWRRAKIAFFGSLWKFRQEYPSYLMEAFQTSGDTLISAERIMQARKSTVTDKDSPLIMAVDPARTGDRTVFAYRQGRQMLEPEVFRFEHDDYIQMTIAGMIGKRIQSRNPVKVFIDVGEGYGIIDRLKELGYGDIVQGVHFNNTPIEGEIYSNKRAEIWSLLKNWVHGEDGEVSLPDSDMIQRDLTSMPRPEPTSTGKIKYPSKELIRKKLGISPDVGDAMALTFSYPVFRPMIDQFQRVTRSNRPRKHTLKTLQRMDSRSTIRRVP